jgi:hypothetical protein
LLPCLLWFLILSTAIGSPIGTLVIDTPSILTIIDRTSISDLVVTITLPRIAL